MLGLLLFSDPASAGSGSVRGSAGGRWWDFIFPTASAPASASSADPDSGPPQPPDDLRIAGRQGNQLILSWSPVSPEGDSELRYDVLRNGSTVASVSAPTATVNFNPAGDELEFFSVCVVDARGLRSAPGNAVLAPRGEALPIELETASVFGYRRKRGFAGLVDPATCFSTAEYSGRILFVQHDTPDGPGTMHYGEAGTVEINYRYTATVTRLDNREMIVGSGTVERWGYFNGAYIDHEVTLLPTSDIGETAPDGSTILRIPLALMTPGLRRTLVSLPGDDNVHALLESDSRNADGFGIYRREEITLQDEFTDAELDSGAEADLAQARPNLPALDWGETQGFSFGLESTGNRPAAVAQRRSAAGEIHVTQLLAEGRYRFRVGGVAPPPPVPDALPDDLVTSGAGSRVQVRWAEIFVPNHGGKPQIQAVFEESLDATDGPAYTTPRNVMLPEEAGVVQPMLLPSVSEMLAEPTAAAPQKMTAPDVLVPGQAVAIGWSSPAPYGSFTLQPQVVRIWLAGDQESVRLVAIDPAIESAAGLEAALSQGEVILPGENLLNHITAAGLRFGQWKLMAIGLAPGRTELTVEFDDSPLTAVRRVLTTLPPAQLAVDANWDGRIALAEDAASDAVSATAPFRFWVNDDDDAGMTGGTDIPGAGAVANARDEQVNGERDLVDFFPVWIDIRPLLDVLADPESVTVRLRQADAALNFTYTDLTPDRAGAALREELDFGFGPKLDQPASEATTERIPADGVALSPEFLEGIRRDGLGMILVEGRAPTKCPLVLSVERDGRVLVEAALPLRLSPVEEMFRHVDLSGVPMPYDGSELVLPETAAEIRTEDPGEPWPDALTNGRYFVFVHGFNVDGRSARGWQSELFKRLHVLGSRARFVGVTWDGATGVRLGSSYTDYHQAVFFAFQTGDALARALAFTDGAEVTVAAHSLGNIVVGEAIQNGGFRPKHYFLINPAVALEAYAPQDVTAGETADMVESEWLDYDSRLQPARWHDLFQDADERSAFTWENRFGRLFDLTDAHNFYSTGEDVVANEEGVHSPSTLGVVLRQGFNLAKGAWKLQELGKGVDWTASLGALLLDRGQAGWSFNPHWEIRYVGGRSTGLSWRARTAAEAETIPNTALATEPFFGRFLEPALTSPDAEAADATAADPRVQFDLLARAIPAQSHAAAANPIASWGADHNFNMQTEGVAPGAVLPTPEAHWRHSDFKTLALPTVLPMYESMIEKGELR